MGSGVVLPLPPCQVTVRLRVVGFTGVTFEEFNSTGLKRRIHRVYVFSFQGQASSPLQIETTVETTLLVLHTEKTSSQVSWPDDRSDFGDYVVSHIEE